MKKALIIDDEPSFSSKFAEFLKERGYEVYATNDITNVMEFIEEYKNFDIIFVDFELSNKKNGAIVGHEIRKKYPLPILILNTAYGGEKIKDFIWVGFDNYLSKYKEGMGADFNKMKSDFDTCIKDAENNQRKRIKIFFDPENKSDEKILTNAKKRLDAIERLLEEKYKFKLQEEFSFMCIKMVKMLIMSQLQLV
jgi:CheY-like chemotaxis protein